MKAVPLCLVAILMGACAGSAAAQNRPEPINSFGYARLGYGVVLATGGSADPAIGFGYRAEAGSLALDISFLNEQLPSGNGLQGESGSTAGSLLKLEALYLTTPKANASMYAGGGISLGATALPGQSTSTTSSTWSGSGLQGELTVGYELPRAGGLRFFVQSDAALPFYRVTGRTSTYTRGQTVVTVAGRRYTPSIVISAGMGWERHRS